MADTTPSPLPQIMTEIDSVGGSVANYADQLGAYLFNPSGNPPPQFDTSALTVDQTLEMVTNNKDSAVDLTAGAMSHTVYKAASIVRELTVRSFTKAMLYDMAVGNAADIKADLTGDSGRKVAELRSTTPAQQEGI